MNRFLLVPSLLLSVTIGQALAAPLSPDMTISSLQVEEIKPMYIPGQVPPNGGFVGPNPGNPIPVPGNVPNGGFAGGTPGNPGPIPSPIPTPGGTYIPGTSSSGKVGEVITAARDIVALGEAVYELAKKGKPRVQTDYAPISVVPKDKATGQPVDPFDMENASMPTERNFVARVKNGAGVEVVTFAYKVVYSYNASYDGIGKYLQSVLIVPVSIKATHGWEFNSTARLSQVLNHGSRANPVAGAMITIKYNINSTRYAFERNDVIHLTGAGELRSFAQ